MKTLALIASLWMITAASAISGEIAPQLLSTYWQNDREQKPILIVLAGQIDAGAVQQEFESRKLPLAERHRLLLDSLRVRNLATRAAMDNSFEILQNAGELSSLRDFWLLNVIAAEATRKGAELVAGVAGVAEVGADAMITPRTAVASEAAEAKLLNVESTLNIIGAPQAWSRGYYGGGRIACRIDQAISTEHPALGARWRGRSAPAAESFFGPATFVETCGNDRLQMLGAVLGADAERGDTVGVAPGAEWIAGRLFCEDEVPFSELLTVLQWAVDPDGKPETFADVPDCICMSWQTGNGCQTTLPQSIFHLFDAVELLGPVCIFAGGNDGANGAASVGYPEAAKLPLGNFSVGNLDQTSVTTRVHASSGRGPSPCDAKLIKPDLVAPGTNVRTTTADGYELATGTDAAAGYVAGTVLLMREANPELSAKEAKRILRDTATDLGPPGADNEFGWGLLNVGKAVEQAKSLGSSGGITGLVRYGGIPLPDAHVELVTAFGTLNAKSDLNGSFEFKNLPTDREYGLRVSRFGYANYVSLEPIVLEKNGRRSVMINLKAQVKDDVEFDQGWELGVAGDDATGGVWERGIPVASSENGSRVQVSSDANDFGTYCFVTGNAPVGAPAGDNDVDGGQTTLRSPVFTLLELDDPVLAFSYAYSNDKGGRKGGDFFRAQISNDGGATWIDLVRTSSSTSGWKEVSLRLDDFIAATDNMVLQFIADDQPPATLVEAAVDDIAITGKPGAPEPPRDLQLDVQFDQVVLKWRKSEGARIYNVYIADNPNTIVLPGNFYTETSDTTLTIPMTEIPYNQFYFQVTASR